MCFLVVVFAKNIEKMQMRAGRFSHLSFLEKNGHERSLFLKKKHFLEVERLMV